MARKNYIYQVAMTGDDIKAYKDKCAEMNRDHTDMTREMMDAFVEGRLRIEPTTAQKEIYREH